LWLFWVAPLIGASIAGFLYPKLFPETHVAVAPGPLAIDAP
jgi:aquaporin Z